MKVLNNQDYQRVRRWVYRYAKYLDIARWRYHFENGSKDDVMEALLFYQNKDGGFGHALEIDCWNPNSTPVCTFIAWRILKEIGCDDKENHVIKGIMNFLESSDYWTKHGCLWSVPTNNQYPVQPWYLYPNAPWFPIDWSPENYTNADFIMFVLKYFDEDSNIYKNIFNIIDYRLSIMPTLTTFFTFAKSDIEQDIETNDWIKLIKCLQEYNLKSVEECNELFETFLEMTKKGANQGVYEKCRKSIENPERIGEAELDEMVEQVVSGIWSEQALLCENPEEKIKEIASLGELWWPINGIIDTLIILKENNRLGASESR